MIMLPIEMFTSRLKRQIRFYQVSSIIVLNKSYESIFFTFYCESKPYATNYILYRLTVVTLIMFYIIYKHRYIYCTNF